MASRVRLGELLVGAKIITEDQLSKALEAQRGDGRRLGTLLVDLGFVTETQVTQVLSQQLSVPWVSLYHVDFSRELLDLVSQELAEAHGLIPIFVRRVRGLGNTLYIAMDDPTNQAGREAVEQYCGLPVRVMISSPTDIASAARAFYGGGSEATSLAVAESEFDGDDEEDEDGVEEEEPATEPPRELGPEQSDSIPAETSLGAETEAREAERPPEPVADPESGTPGTDPPELEYREVELDEDKRRIVERATEVAHKPGRRVITLTLLDGTQVQVPAPGGAQTGASVNRGAQHWTTRDLVVALRRASRGQKLSDILGEDVQWEGLFAALLSLLLKKHLIADWEFVEAYQKFKGKKRT